MEPTIPLTHGSFNGLNIAPNILEVLDREKFTVPTPIQASCIPSGVEGKDIIGIAQTGTGKTLAFGIPMIQRVIQNAGHGLIILPTRELALQVDETFQRIGRSLGIRTAVLIGGASMGLQKQMIRNRPNVVIATPGRLIDHLEHRTITLNTVKILVLDEADRMLDMGFAPQINKILLMVPKDRQTMLFSATMPTEIVKIATTHMQLPLRVEVAPAGTTADRVEQEVFIVNKADKIRLLEHILKESKGSILVFSRTKYGAKKITHAVAVMGHKSAEIHSNRSLAQRKEALEGFRNGRYRVLIATDIASRGIDVTGIELVINYDLPDDPSDYVHRIGRTARAGREGKAISFVEPSQSGAIRNIERLVRKQITRKPLPTSLPVAVVMPRIARDEERFGSRPPQGQNGRPSFSRGGRGGDHKRGARSGGGGRSGGRRKSY